MPITVVCSGCGKPYRVSDQAAGKRLRCRECGRDMVVPMPGGASDESDPFEALVAMEQGASPPAPPPPPRRPLIKQRPVEDIAVKGENLRDRPQGPRFGRSKSPTIATDNLSPWAVIVFVLLQLLGAILQTVQASHAGGAEHGKVIGAIWTEGIARIAMLFLVLGPAVYLGVFIMSKIFRCAMVDFGYLRGCGIAAIPAILVSAAAYIPPNIQSQLGDSLGLILMLVVAAVFFFALKYVFDLDWVGTLVSYAFSAPLYSAAAGVAANLILASVLAQVFGSKTVPPRQFFDQGPLVLVPKAPSTTQSTIAKVDSGNTPAKSDADLQEKTAKTEDNLRQIGQALQKFAAASGKNAFPPSLDALAASGDLPPHCINSPFQRPNPGGYTYWPDRSPAMPGDVGIAYDAAELASQGGTHVLFANGNVEFRSSDQFNSLVSRSSQEVSDWQADQKFKEKQRQEAMARTTTAPTPTEQTPTTPKPQDFVSIFNAQKSPFVAAVIPVFLEEKVRAIVSPVTPSAWAAVVHEDAPTEDSVELWDLSESKSKGSASFDHEVGAHPTYAIASDGSLLARIVDFPKLGIRLWSARENRDTRTILLNDALGTPTFLGFLSPEKLAVIWHKGEDDGMQIFDALTGEVLRSVPFARFTRTVNDGVINPDGREFAFTSAQIQRGSPQIALFNLYAPPSTKWRWHEILDVDKAQVDAPAGLAYSPDGKKIAALFAKEGAGYIICWRVADLKPLGEYDVFVPAAAGASERGLEWVANGKAWLIMGNTLVDAADGKRLGQLDSPPTIRQWSIGPDSLALMYQEDGKTGVAIAKLDASKFGTPATKP